MGISGYHKGTWTPFHCSQPVLPASSDSPRCDTDTGPDSTVGFDDRYVLLDSKTAQPLASTEYAIRRASGDAEFGITDAEGRTHLLAANAQAEDVTIFVEG